MKKISIVTISFNQKEFITECIDSVIKQNYPNTEHIVVDAGSTDGSREIINSYGDKVIKIFEADKGPADGLNKGFSKATGEIYYFLNSDDYLLDGALERINREFTENPNIDVVCGAGFIVNEKGKNIKTAWNSKFTPWLCLHGGITFFQQGCFFKKTIFEKARGFNIHNSTCWDGELFLNMSLNGGKFKIIRQKLASFRIHSSSISGTKRLQEKYLQDGRAIRLKHSKIYNPRLINKLLARLFNVFYVLPYRILDKICPK